MTLKRRIDQLAPKKGKSGAAPSVIFLCDAETGEARAAMILGGETLSRGLDETDEDFRTRASAGVPGAVCLPDSGREALATGEAPEWAKGKLALRALEQKHATDP